MKWKTRSLAELASEESNSFVDGPFGSNLKASEYEASGVPIVRLQNVRPNRFLHKDIKFISERKAAELKRHDFRTGDLIIAKLGDPCAVACIVPDGFPNGRIVADVVRFRGKADEVNSKFIAYFLNSPAAKAQIEAGTTGTTRKRVNLTRLKAIKIPLPPLAEQRRIAEVLDRAEALRAKRRAALAELDSLTQAIFLDMFGDPATNPKGWPHKAMGELASKFSDGPFGSNLKSEHYTDTGVRVVRLQNIGVGEFVDNDSAFISEKHFAALKKHECLPGDVLVGTLGDPNLRACIQPDWLKVALNKADCVQIRPNPTVANASFICALLNQPSTERLAQELMHGQTRVRISMGRLRGLHVPVPPVELQGEFANKMTSVEQLKAAHFTSLAELDALFASLQHRAFRGEL